MGTRRCSSGFICTRQGFNKFRGWSKFIYPAVLFLIMLAAVGFDRMLRAGTVRVGGSPPRRWRLGGALLLTAGGAAMRRSRTAERGGLGRGSAGSRSYLHRTGEQLTPFDHIQKLSFIRGAADFAAFQILDRRLYDPRAGAGYSSRRGRGPARCSRCWG